MDEMSGYPKPNNPLGYTAEEFAVMHGFEAKRSRDLFDAVRRNRPHYFELDPETGCYVLPERWHGTVAKEISSPIYQFLGRSGVDQYNF